MSDIDAKLKHVLHTPSHTPCIAPLLEHLVSVCGRPLQFQQSIISFMTRIIPRTMEMGEKTLNIFTEDIIFLSSKCRYL